ncbi:ketoacyl-ACP synthase III [Paenibacillus oryzisoli]|uniref:ketoacyl-ACP synthase III n=1 Tax=Paenibacillus oryzisoli TaxID=1850517 RepID=UPI003D26CE35
MSTLAPLNARITGIGTYVPSRILTNEQLPQLVETNDEWIVQRTGIHERRIAAEHEYTSDLCIAAVDNLLARYPGALDGVELVIAATHTPDLSSTPIACLVQAHFGLTAAGAYDVNATCAGFTYALHQASALAAAGAHRKILVVSGDTLSKITDYTDRSTCILFGDGAGAVIVERDDAQPAFLAHHIGADGRGAAHVYRTGLAQQLHGLPLDGDGKLVQNGREVYRFAVSTVPQGVERLLAKSELTIGDVDWFIPHSANLRMIDSICEKLGLPLSKALTSMEYYGNTSAASIPLALDLGVQGGRVKPGDLLLLYGFGGGLTHAGLLVRWG